MSTKVLHTILKIGDKIYYLLYQKNEILTYLKYI